MDASLTIGMPPPIHPKQSLRRNAKMFPRTAGRSHTVCSILERRLNGDVVKDGRIETCSAA